MIKNIDLLFEKNISEQFKMNPYLWLYSDNDIDFKLKSTIFSSLFSEINIIDNQFNQILSKILSL
jgi:hypothetical protein